MDSLACLNGEIVPVEEAKVSIWDRGFLFGDAVYEALRIYQGRCWLEEDHWERLRRSLKEMGFPRVDLDRLRDRVRRVISVSEIREGIAYLQITRGVAPRLHAFPNPPVEPTEVIVIRAYDDQPTANSRQSGVTVVSQPDWRWRRCDVKSTNLLANVLANEAAHRAGGYEAVLVAEDGEVTEATHSSVLWVRDGRIEATPEGPHILPGTTRKFLRGLAEAVAMPLLESRIGLDALKKADEVILLGTGIEVLPVVRVDLEPVAGGTPGPVTRGLQAAYQDAVARWLASSRAD